MRYVDTVTASNHVNITLDHVRRLIRNQQLVARKEGTVLQINVVDVWRLKKLYSAIDNQDETKPDILWVQEACNYLLKEMSKISFMPQQVIAIANGGLVPAAIISAIIRPRLFFSIKVSLYDGQTKLASPVMSKLPDTIQQIPTLIVDDITDTGTTLTLIEKELESIGVIDTKFAVLHKKLKSTFKPDLYATETDKWIIYPWEVSI